jgi:hypothetical protein
MDEIDTPLDGQMNGHIGQMDGQIDDEPPLDGQMNDYIDQMDGQIDDEPPLDGQMNELFPTSTKKWVARFSKRCWLCDTTPYQFAHVLGKADRGVLLLQRT